MQRQIIQYISKDYLTENEYKMFKFYLMMLLVEPVEDEKEKRYIKNLVYLSFRLLLSSVVNLLNRYYSHETYIDQGAAGIS